MESKDKIKRLIYLFIYNLSTEAKIVYKIDGVDKYVLGYIASITANDVTIKPTGDTEIIISLSTITNITLYQKFKTIYEE